MLACSSGDFSPSLSERKKHRLGGHADLNLTAQQVRNRGRGTFVGNENDVAGGSDPEELEAHMRTNAHGGAGRELARIGLGVLHEFLQRFRRDRRVDHQRIGVEPDQTDAGEVLDRFEVERAIERGDGVGVGTAQQQRVAIRAGVCHELGAGPSAAARLILTMTLCPSRVESGCVTRRAATSAGPPGGYGTTILISRSG